ncbi:MAG: glycosyltransferase family 4 protein [Taibaiella sp.]|nr:glycosyltransferase family 4 protein [Taibaiella sp.]
MAAQKKLKILLLADPLANAKHWINGLEQYGDAEVTNWHLNQTGRIKRTLEWITMLLTIKKKVKRFAPDIIIGYRLTSYGFLAAWSGYHPCVIAAQGITDVWPQNHWTTPFKALLARYAIKHADKIHAWGQHMTDSIVHYGASPSQLFVLPRGIDLGIFYPVQKQYIKGQKINMCVTRALFPEYGHMVILKALKLLVDNGYDISLAIAGNGTELENLQSFVKKNGLSEHVSFLGYVPNGELPELLRRSDIYISMPDTEGVSASLLEAMGCGCLPIVSDLPANRAFIIDGKNGYLVEVGNEQMLFDKIKTTLNNESIFNNAILENIQYIKQNTSLKKNMQLFGAMYRRLIQNNNSINTNNTNEKKDPDYRVVSR